MNISVFTFLLSYLVYAAAARFLTNEFEQTLGQQFHKIKSLEEDSAFYGNPDSTNEALAEPEEIPEDNKEVIAASLVEETGNGEKTEHTSEELETKSIQLPNVEEKSVVPGNIEDVPVPEEDQIESEKNIKDTAINDQGIIHDLNIEDTVEEENKPSDMAVNDEKNTTVEKQILSEDDPKKSEENLQNAYPYSSNSELEEPSKDEELNTSEIDEASPKLRMSSSPDLMISMKGRSGDTSLEQEDESRSGSRFHSEPRPGSWIKPRRTFQPPFHLPLPLQLPKPQNFFPPRLFPIPTTPLPLMRRNENPNLMKYFNNLLNRPISNEVKLQPSSGIPQFSQDGRNSIDDYSLSDSYLFQPSRESNSVSEGPVSKQNIMSPPIDLPALIKSIDLNNFRRNLPNFPLSNGIRYF